MTHKEYKIEAVVEQQWNGTYAIVNYAMYNKPNWYSRWQPMGSKRDIREAIAHINRVAEAKRKEAKRKSHEDPWWEKMLEKIMY